MFHISIMFLQNNMPRDDFLNYVTMIMRNAKESTSTLFPKAHVCVCLYTAELVSTVWVFAIAWQPHLITCGHLLLMLTMSPL